MATDWVTITADDVAAVLSSNVLSAAELASPRAARVLALEVERVRGTIRDAGRVSVSATAGTVPPGAAQKHTAVLAAWTMVAGAPGVAGLAINGPDGGTVRGLTDLYEEAVAWLAAVAAGQSVAAPSDPEDPDAGGSVRYGEVDNQEVADLATQGPLTND